MKPPHPYGQGTRIDARTQKVTKSILERYPTRGCLCKSKACLTGNGSFAPGDRRARSCLPVISLSEDARDGNKTGNISQGTDKVQRSGCPPLLVDNKINEG